MRPRPSRAVLTQLVAAMAPLAALQWGLRHLRAPAPWVNGDGTGVSVAVLYCGIHASHPDLAGQVVLERNYTASSTTDDLCNHGTHVAGIVAATAGNGIGVA